MSERTYSSRARPCAVCGDQGGGCSQTRDGLILCRKSSGNQPGFQWLSKGKPAAGWHLYRHENNPRAFFSPSSKGASAPSTNWPDLATQWAAALTEDRAQELAENLGLPVHALQALRLGWDECRSCWTFPETDATGKVQGAFCRWPDGRRAVLRGSKRGLYLPEGWRDRPGPVRVCEGASDVLALTLLGLPCVGRPSAMVGAELLAELLRDVHRDVVILGDNDAKPNGRWPGRDGAEHVAGKLRALLPGRKVVVRFPPEGHKDVRAWLQHRGLGAA